MRRFGCFFLALALFGLSRGCQDLYVAATNREPLPVTVAELSKGGVSATWVKVTDAHVDYTQAVFQTSADEKRNPADAVRDIFVPVRSLSSPDAATVKVLLHDGRLATRDLLRPLLDRDTPEATRIGYLVQNRAQIVRDGPVSGLIQFGMSGDRKTNELLMSSKVPLEADFVIVEAGAEPELGFSLFCSAVSAVLLVIALAAIFGGANAPAEPAPR